jgi:hypothetical protein
MSKHKHRKKMKEERIIRMKLIINVNTLIEMSQLIKNKYKKELLEATKQFYKKYMNCSLFQ